jgi:hypothetical protein
MKLNVEHILEDAAAMVLAIGGIALAGMLAFPLLQRLGLFSYLGFSPGQVDEVFTKLQATYPVVSKVHGGDIAGHYWERGILGGSYPLYFRYDKFADAGRDLHLYPMLTELWSTSPDYLGSSGHY